MKKAKRGNSKKKKRSDKTKVGALRDFLKETKMPWSLWKEYRKKKKAEKAASDKIRALKPKENK